MKTFRIEMTVPALLKYTWDLKAETAEIAAEMAMGCLQKEQVGEDGDYIEPTEFWIEPNQEEIELEVQEFTNLN